MSYDHLSDTALLSAIAEYAAAEGLAKAQAYAMRNELKRRQVENGEVSLSHNGWVSRLKREAFSVAWLRRQTGYTMEDLPPECITEKVVPEVDWERVDAWHRELHGCPLETTYTLTVEREKVK